MKRDDNYSNNPTLTVSLEPYLREFLTYKLRDEIHFSSRKSILGAIMEPLLEYMPEDYSPPEPSKDDFTFYIPYNFNKLDTRQYTVYMSEHNKKIFRRILYLYFKEVFYSYMDDKVRYLNEIQNCIMLFCSDYNISFDAVNFETLKKSYYRYRLKKNPTKLSLNSPLTSVLCPYTFQTP